MLADREREYLVADAGTSVEPEIGGWLWALEDARKYTHACLEGLLADHLDWLPPNRENSIATLLYHIALVEADWLYVEVLEQPYPPSAVALFPYPVRDEQGLLTKVEGVPLAEHMMRLDAVRQQVLDIFQSMSLVDFQRARRLPDYDVSPQWVLHHLLQHEAEHRSDIAALRSDAERHHATKTEA